MNMTVGQVIELAKEWVEIYGSQIPGFCGAHLMGGLNYMPKDAPFPSYKDVDMNILSRDSQSTEVHDLSYKGLILEYGAAPIEDYQSPERVLADPSLASNLAVNSILSDPIGMLAPLQKAVELEYSCRKWVVARCDSAKNSAQNALIGLRQANSPFDAYPYLSEFITSLSGLIAFAGLKPPTHRRSLVLAKKVLEIYGQADLHEEILEGYGSIHMSKAEVEAYLLDCAAAFDKAVQVTRTPFPFQFKLHAHVKPYFVEGSREMIEEGYHREAVPWIAAGTLISAYAIQLDAPEDDKPPFLAAAYKLLSALRLTSPEDIESRVQQAKALTERVCKAADFIVNENSEIT
jgi:hypothetical protein